MRELFKVWITVPVRWGDMDAFGHVNNASYFTYCESARIRYFEALGLEALSRRGPEGPAIVTASCNFQRQVCYPATLEVGARVSRVGGKSFHLDYALFHAGTDELVADGSSVAVWVDFEAGKALPLPEALREKIRTVDGVGEK